MPENRISNMTSTTLPLLTKRMITQITAHPTEYPTMGEKITQGLSANTAALVAANDAAETARAAYRQAVQNRDSARRTLASTAQEVARLAYASPLSPGLIAALGLSPRSTSRARVVPATPQNLVANPQVDGDVRLEWTGGAPGRRVRYVVEGQTGSGWGYLIDVGSTRVTLSDYAPGVASAFRVRASANGTLSAPSNEAAIYPSSPALHVVEGRERKAA